jgi:hypothetical protein
MVIAGMMRRVKLRNLSMLATMWLVCVACVAGIPPAAQAKAKAPSCDARAGTTLLANREVRIFRREAKRGFHTYACFRASRGLTSFGDDAEFSASTIINGVRLEGHFVAYTGVTYYQGRDRLAGITVLNAKTGKGLGYSAMSPTASTAGGGQDITAFGVTAGGALAWIAATADRAAIELHLVVANRDQVVASGADIDPASLALTEAVAYWTQAGTAHSAPIPA